MKRSRRIVLMLMGSAAVGSLTGRPALARNCAPASSGTKVHKQSAACKTRGGFGTSPRTFSERPNEYLGGS